MSKTWPISTTASALGPVSGKVKSESWRGDSNPQPPVYKDDHVRSPQAADLR